jgi:hypothetical protein
MRDPWLVPDYLVDNEMTWRRPLAPFFSRHLRHRPCDDGPEHGPLADRRGFLETEDEDEDENDRVAAKAVRHEKEKQAGEVRRRSDLKWCAQ